MHPGALADRTLPRYNTVGCELVLMFNWIHTLLGNAASSLSKADSLYCLGPIHPWGHYIASKVRYPVTHWRIVTSKVNVMLCISLTHVSRSSSYCGHCEITRYRSGVKLMQSFMKILQLVQTLGPLQRRRTNGRANSLAHGRDVLFVPYKIRKI